MGKRPTCFEGLDFLRGRRTWDGGVREQFFGRWKTVLKIIQNGEKTVLEIVQNGETGTQKNSEEVVNGTGMGRNFRKFYNFLMF